MSSNNSKDRASLCAFTFSDGRQCRMPRHSKKSQYCFGHERALLDVRSKLATAFALNSSKSDTKQTALSPFEITTYEEREEGEGLASNYLSNVSLTTNLSLQPPTPPDNSEDRSSLCAFTFSDGRKCRMLRHSKKSAFCFHHERKLCHLREIDRTASEICEPIAGDFVPATALTQSLTRAFRAVAEGRFDPRTANALSRLASTLLKSIGASSHEFQSCYLEGYWRQLVRAHYHDLPDYIPPTPRQPRRRRNSPPPPDDSDS